MLERSQSLLQYCNNIASLQDWYSTDHTPLQDDGDDPMMDVVKGCRPDIDTETRREYGDTSTKKQTVVSVDPEHRNGCASWVKPVNGGQV